MQQRWRISSGEFKVYSMQNTNSRLYKCIQSAGAAGVFRMDSNLVPYMTMLAVTWGLCIAGIVCLVPLIGLRIKNHTSQEDEKVAVAKEHFVEEHQL